jgi:primosomal protein N'
VPSSGKSEVYFHSIARALAHGRDVLLLLPEIALTTQFVGRVQKIFGDRVVLYHSGLSDRRRAEAYIRLARSGGGSLIVGTRSAIFLPMPRLGLVVVDEEQDSGYKQQDPAPRYNARDTAIVLANLNDARVILVSATPSLETWANATSGKYGLVTLTERWGGTHPPEVVISDTLRAVKRGERRGHINKELSDAISAALTRGEQVILFQNRRGVAPFIECTDCGHVPGCDHCGIPMTVHRGTLRCHYCGAVTPAPSLCPSCGGMNLTTRGFGTEKIEEELARIFPAARIARLDRDSASSERAYRRIIDDFEAGATDILVGTQMITKGLDFAGVTLVGVLNADNLAAHPDFRASERAYALIAQVAGRAGRHAAPLAKAEIPPAAGVDSAQTPLLQEGGVPPLAGGGVVGLSLAAGEIPLHAKEGWRPKGDGVVDTPPRGRVIIQTASPDNPLISKAAAGDYRAMASELLAERSMYGYPPFTRLVSIMLRHPDRDTLAAAAQKFKELLETKNSECDLHSELLGPQPPIVEKIKGEFALIFLVKIPKTDPLTVTRVAIRRSVETLAIDHAWRRVSVTVNVDPI